VPTPARPPCRVEPDAKPSAVTEALRRHVDRYLGRHGLDPDRARVLNRLLACRTATLGTHLCVCEACGWTAPMYNQCRDRHCPQCQGHATTEWLDAQKTRMLPTPHFQVVFTLPGDLRPIAFDNQEVVYALLMRVGASILKDLAAQRFDARLGITAVLHTWDTKLQHHPHVHYLVTAGGLSLDDERWVETREDFLFPGRILGSMFRGRFLEALIDGVEGGDIELRGDPVEAAKAFRSTVHGLAKRHARWVVHVEPPAGRPVEYALKYLARYVKRVAISASRIVEVTDDDVTFKTREGLLTLDGAKFVHRFLLHVLPPRFCKVRHYGLYAPGIAKVRLEAARRLLRDDAGPLIDVDDDGPSPEPPDEEPPDESEPDTPRLEICPACGEARVRRIFCHQGHPGQPRGPP